MSKNFLIIKLFETIGLTVNKDNVIQDQDTRSIINYRGFNLTYNNFDPIENRDLAISLFKYFLKKIETYMNLYCLIFFEERNEINKTRIVMNTSNGTYISNYYYNKALAYIDIILMLNGINTNNLVSLDTQK